MTRLLICILVFSTAACDDKLNSHRNVIRSIESAVELPEGASSLASYERYYAQKADGIVIGVYTNHDSEHRRGVLRACKGLRDKPYPCPTDAADIRLVEAGESVWLDDPTDLPAMSGGGCAQITLQYELASGRFLEVECNGPY
ncbi:MAG: hypothetical protein ACTHK5_06870 [Tsuneonella sp.]